MIIDVNKAITSLGSNVILNIDEPFERVLSITSFDDQIDGLGSTVRISREFSISYDSNKDKREWSQWYTITDVNLNAFIDFSNDPFWMKFRYTITQKYDNTPIVIKYIELSLKQKEKIEDDCIIDHTVNFENSTVIDYEALGDPFVQIQNDLNNFINRQSPIEVLYFRTEPDIDTTDPFLNEYSLHRVVNNGGTCIKVVVQDNLIPEPKHEYNEWGLDFDEFTVDVSKEYFEETFGKDIKPRDEDYMYFHRANRMYRVHSTVLNRGINESSTYYTLSLKKYDENTSVIKEGEALDFLKENTISHEELFKDQLDEEKLDIVNDQQNSMKTIADDVVRSLVNENMNIIDDSVFNNGTMLMKSYYDMCKIPFDQVAVKYKPSHNLLSGESWANTSWINIPSTNNNSVTLNIISQERVDFNSLKLTFDKPIRNIGLKTYDSIYRFQDTYDVESIIDDNTIVVNSRNNIDVSKTDMYKKAEKHNLHTTVLENQSVFQINLYNLNKVQIRFGNILWDIGGFNLDINKWYGFVINISDLHGYIGLYIWELEPRSVSDDDPTSTRLKQTFKKEISLPKGCIIIPKGSIACIAGSNIHMSNIRILNKKIDHEFQSYFIGNRGIKKASIAHIIDDAEVIFNLGVIGRGNTYITERMEWNEKRKLDTDDRI